MRSYAVARAAMSSLTVLQPKHHNIGQHRPPWLSASSSGASRWAPPMSTPWSSRLNRLRTSWTAHALRPARPTLERKETAPATYCLHLRLHPPSSSTPDLLRRSCRGAAGRYPALRSPRAPHTVLPFARRSPRASLAATSKSPQPPTTDPPIHRDAASATLDYFPEKFVTTAADLFTITYTNGYKVTNRRRARRLAAARRSRPRHRRQAPAPGATTALCPRAMLAVAVC